MVKRQIPVIYRFLTSDFYDKVNFSCYFTPIISVLFGILI